MPSAFALADDPLFMEHRAPALHPERPERLLAARRAIESAALPRAPVVLAARDASDAELARVHSNQYIEELGRMADKSGYWDVDTYFAKGTTRAARRAAGASIALALALLDGTARFGAALLRPPGHHARANGAMGFCILNNVAIAAAAARAAGVTRVMIVDFDVHHGNGTQEMFYADPSVLYVSVHQSPFYPGTGAVDEQGEGEGRGFSVNVPLSAGADDTVYDAAFERLIAPVAELYKPGLLLLSAGFDAHLRDPLAGMRVSESGYAAMIDRLIGAVDKGVPIGLVLEGGYDLQGLESSLRRTVEALFAGPGEQSPGRIGPRHEQELAQAVLAAKNYWKLG